MSLGTLKDTLKDINLEASSHRLGTHQLSILNCLTPMFPTQSPHSPMPVQITGLLAHTWPLGTKGHRASSRGGSVSASPGTRDNSSGPCPVQAGTNCLSFPFGVCRPEDIHRCGSSGATLSLAWSSLSRLLWLSSEARRPSCLGPQHWVTGTCILHTCLSDMSVGGHAQIYTAWLTLYWGATFPDQ